MTRRRFLHHYIYKCLTVKDYEVSITNSSGSLIHVPRSDVSYNLHYILTQPQRHTLLLYQNYRLRLVLIYNKCLRILLDTPANIYLDVFISKEEVGYYRGDLNLYL